MYRTNAKASNVLNTLRCISKRRHWCSTLQCVSKNTPDSFSCNL